ncbi:hypothetical protein V3W47_08685 [Deinococcus sp. YIM 134068]|uniref:hypothetical protein n=1 Tax=Deinococcus lichenicola TaxID=3118910 RepID=UPI002F95609F
MASLPSLRRGCLWLVLALAAALLVFGLVLTLIARGQLPLSSLPVTVLVLGLGGAALGLVFTLSLTGPALSRRRELALARVLAEVTAGKYRPAPDEVWLFKRRGWWTHTRELTPLGQAVLDRRRGEERRV